MSNRHEGLSERLGELPVGSFACFVLDVATDNAELFGDSRQLFRWASVSKLASTLGVLSAVSEGVFELGEKLPNGSILSDVLAHASGLAADIIQGAEVTSQKPVVPPRTRRIYSNAGFELLARSLELSTGYVFKDYLRESLFDVSGMRSASMSGELWLTAGRSGAAAGMIGTIEDLLALARTLVSGSPLVDHELLSQAKLPYLPELPGILPGFGEMDRNYWGLGIEIRGDKHPHWTSKLNSFATYGHFGAAGTFLWIDPDRGVACGLLTDRTFGAWAQKAWPELSTYVVEEY